MLFRWRDTLCFAFFCKNLSTWHSFFIIFGVCMCLSLPRPREVVTNHEETLCPRPDQTCLRTRCRAPLGGSTRR